MFQIRSARLIFNVEQTNEAGQVTGMKEVPINLYEAQFGASIASLVSQLLEQANGSPEPKEEVGEDKKEE